MLQFVLNVKETKNKLFLYLFPVGVYGAHQVLVGILEVFPNYGVSFGINLPMIKLFLLVFLLILFWSLLKRFNWWTYFIFVGGIVNFCDRLFFGYVRDYFKIMFFYNNLADLLIFVALVFYIIELFYETNRNNLRR
jgi:lipoprotein signal peptidase